MELKKHTEESASKVAAVLQRAEEQGHMIEALHASVILYNIMFLFLVQDLRLGGGDLGFV